MQIKFLRLRLVAFVAGAVMLASSGLASADPPSRVARMGYLSGNVSYSPAGVNDWLRASINRPLTTGDRIWVDSRARAEIQIGGAMVRVNSDTSVSILNLDDRIAQLRLAQGTLNVRVRRLGRDQVFEVDTPNLAFTLSQPGEYRITVDPDGYATDIFVRRGQGEAYGDGAAYIIDSRQGYSFTGSNLRDYEYIGAPRFDDFDRWSSDRDRRYENSPTARYVSQDVIGYEDLDATGNWRLDATYGNVWFPNRVSAGWAPYRDGHWAWVDPWGWTWIDDAPWGFAVSHYGRWTNLRGTWGWVPGPVRERAYYAPALVAFVGGNNFQLSFSSGNAGAVAWFPLAPREIYQPSYAVSRGYFEHINRSNTIINNTIINNTVINNTYYNSNVTNVVYANQSVPGAIIAVPTTTFTQSRQVAQSALPVSQAIIASAPVAAVPRLAPSAMSVRGAAVQSSAPPPSMFDRPVVARSAPPAPPASFAVQQQQLTARQGSPLDDAARRELKSVMAAPAPVVRVVAPAQMAQPTAPPPPAAGPGRVSGGRDTSSDRNAPSLPSNARVPGAVPQFAPPAPAAPTQPQTGRPEQRLRGEQQQTQPFAPSPTQGAAPTPVPSPPMAPPAPTMKSQSPEQRGRPEQRGQSEQQSQSQFAPRQAIPAPTSPPQFAPQAPTPQPQEERGRFEQRGRSEQQRVPQVAPQAPVAAPRLPPQAPALPPSAPREKSEQSDRGEPRRKPVMAPPQAPPGAVQAGKDTESIDAKQRAKKKDDERKREEEGRKPKE